MDLEDYNPSGTARERVSEGKMERYLEQSDTIKVEVIELEHFLLGPECADVSINLPQKTRGMKEAMVSSCCSTPRGKGTRRGVEVADAARFAKAAREVRRPEAASATRTIARPCAGITKGRKHQSMFSTHSYSWSFNVVYAWMSRGRVTTERMITYLARERQNVFVEVEELETYILSSKDTEGVIGVLAWSACDHEGRKRSVAIKREGTTLVANTKQYAVMRA